MFVLCSQEVKKRNMCSDIFRHKQRNEHISFLRPACVRWSTSAALPNGGGMSVKVNQSRSFRVRRERKRSSGLLSLWKYPKRYFSYSQTTNDDAFPPLRCPPEKFIAFHAQFSNGPKGSF